jgi:hypothetical protein
LNSFVSCRRIEVGAGQVRAHLNQLFATIGDTRVEVHLQAVPGFDITYFRLTPFRLV